MNANLNFLNKHFYCLFFIFFTFCYSNNLWSQCALSCSAVQLSLDENCQAEVTVNTISGGSDSTCLGPLIVEVYDLNGNIISTSPIITGNYVNQQLIGKIIDQATGNSCSDTILIEDKLPPVITCPIDTGIYIMEFPDPSLTGNATAVDACGFSTITKSDQVAFFGPMGGDTVEVVTRTWYAEDASGNIDSCEQLIYLIKPDLSLVTFPPNLDNVASPALECGSENTSIANCGEPHINGYLINNINGFSSSFLDTQVGLCGGSYALYREWKVIDLAAAQDIEHNQVIMVDDKTPPSLTCPTDITIATGGANCASTVIVPNPLTSDPCSTPDSITVVLQVSSGQVSGNTIYDLDSGTHSATCVATDACGNQSTCNFTITVMDEQPPVAVSNSSPNVTLVPIGATLVNASTFDDGSWDNCGNITLSARRMNNALTCDTLDAQFAPMVPFYCCDVGDTIMVELKVADDSGNESFAMSQVTVYDNTNPGILCAADITIDCTVDYSDLDITGHPTGTDNCTGFQMDFTDVVDINNCGEGTVTRTWNIEDASGHTANCTQVITLENPNVFYINPTDPLDPNDDIIWPLDYTSFTCNGIYNPDSLPVGHDYPEIVVDTCQDIGISFEDTDITIVQGACRRILRTWVIIDFCQFDPLTFEGKWEYGQIIEILNSEQPQFEEVCEDLVFCSMDTECQDENFTIKVAAMDDCTPENLLTYQYELDLFQDGNIDEASVGKSINIDFPIGNHSVTFTVEDACGQSNTCSYDFEVVDCLLPNPVCYLSLGIQLNGDSVSIQAEDLNEGSSDNCSPTNDLVYSFSSDTTHTDSMFTCDQVGFNAVQVWVTDLDGNQSFCTAYVEIQDNGNTCVTANTASVVGSIKNEVGDNIEQVEMHINNTTLAPFITGVDGLFSFLGLSTGEDYELEPQKTINHLNGVTTYDIVLISKHILGLELLDSPYKIIAADVNSSGSITGLDMVEIRKLILHFEDEFPDGKSWRFVDKNYVFTNPANPLTEDFPEIIEIDNLNSNMDFDFVAIKKGDVNNTAVPNDLLQAPTRTRANNLSLHLDNQTLIPNERISVDITSTNFNDIDGFQFTLFFNPEKLDFETIQAPHLPNWTITNFNLQQISAGQITVSWNGDRPLNLEKSQPVFSLEMMAKRKGNLNEEISIISQPTLAEAYSRGEIWDLKLVTNESYSTSFLVKQNIPNPFSETTIIEFVMPDEGSVDFAIFNLDGKMIYEKNNSFTKGSHQIEIDKNDLQSEGVFYYQFKSEYGMVTRKMIVIN